MSDTSISYFSVCGADMQQSYIELSLRKSLMVEVMGSNSPIGDSRFFQVETAGGEANPQ